MWAAFVIWLLAVGRRQDARALATFIPVAGQLDDAIIAALVLRHFVRAGGEQFIRELWPGPQPSLELILRLARA